MSKVGVIILENFLFTEARMPKDNPIARDAIKAIVILKKVLKV
jgi:hypothetical protein